MIRATYVYSFIDFSGKPKRFLESKECKILTYGVTMDIVSLCVLFEDEQSYTIINELMYERYNVKPTHIIHI